MTFRECYFALFKQHQIYKIFCEKFNMHIFFFFSKKNKIVLLPSMSRIFGKINMLPYSKINIGCLLFASEWWLSFYDFLWCMYSPKGILLYNLLLDQFLFFLDFLLSLEVFFIYFSWLIREVSTIHYYVLIFHYLFWYVISSVSSSACCIFQW